MLPICPLPPLHPLNRRQMYSLASQLSGADATKKLIIKVRTAGLFCYY